MTSNEVFSGRAKPLRREDLTGKDARPALLTPGQTLFLQTRSLVLEGQVLDVREGPRTDDGPSIAFASIHLRARPR